MWCGEREVQLARLEYELLIYLARHAGRVVGYRELLVEVWEYKLGSGREAIKSCVKRLRRKLPGQVAADLVCVCGVGYMLRKPESYDDE